MSQPTPGPRQALAEAGALITPVAAAHQGHIAALLRNDHTLFTVVTQSASGTPGLHLKEKRRML